MVEELLNESRINEKDLELLRESAGGNHEAFRLLVEKYQRHVFQICLGFVRGPHDAEDLTQDVFFQIYENAGPGKHTWAHLIRY